MMAVSFMVHTDQKAVPSSLRTLDLDICFLFASCFLSLVTLPSDALLDHMFFLPLHRVFYGDPLQKYFL